MTLPYYTAVSEGVFDIKGIRLICASPYALVKNIKPYRTKMANEGEKAWFFCKCFTWSISYLRTFSFPYLHKFHWSKPTISYTKPCWDPHVLQTARSTRCAPPVSPVSPSCCVGQGPPNPRGGEGLPGATCFLTRGPPCLMGSSSHPAKIAPKMDGQIPIFGFFKWIQMVEFRHKWEIKTMTLSKLRICMRQKPGFTYNGGPRRINHDDVSGKS